MQETRLVSPALAAEVGMRLDAFDVAGLAERLGWKGGFSLDLDAPRASIEGKYKRRVSVSQIQEFLKCPRRWALHRLAKVPRIPNEALIFGIILHASLALYLESKTKWARRVRPASKIGAMTQAMARCVRVLEIDSVHIEPEWLLSVDDLKTDIYIKPDLLLLRQGKAYVDDWKSTSARMARSPWVLQGRAGWEIGEMEADAGASEKLPPGGKLLWNDVQPRIYSHGVCERYDVAAVTCQWVYGSKSFADGQEPKTWSAIETFSAPKAKAWCKKYLWPVIQTMNALREAYEAGEIDSALLVPHRPDGCDHIGRFCDALGTCKFQKSPVPLEVLHLPVIPA